MKTPYRGFWIELDPKPIPLRQFDWDWWSEDSEQSGTAGSKQDCEAAIDEAIEEDDYL